jgi:flagellum-specific ATP synthase
LAWNGGDAAAVTALVADFEAHVAGAGEVGCGFEAPLEAWYRFLVDPQPPQEIVVDPATDKATMVGLARSVLVVATSDQSPLLRMRGAFVATTLAEYFCAQGKSVLLMMDSVTRFAMAMREVGLAIGEPPATKGYTPSVFATLPKLLERAGSFRGEGSITGLYTVLVEGDDMNEPIADAVRSILDGHIVLSRALAARNHYPCIDVLTSASRVMRDITSPQHQEMAGRVREILATYREAEDLINIGAYAAGSNPRIDRAIGKIEAVNRFLHQKMTEAIDLDTTLAELQALGGC